MAYRILLVEDNPHIMEINSEALMMEDYEVLEAVDGKSCMEIVRSQEVDLAVLDIMLPDVDGLELCRQIKKEYDIPILFLTALGENAQIIEGLRAGGDDYLPKPYDIGVLLARIEARLRDSMHRKRFVSCHGIKLDTMSMIGTYGDKDLLLTQKEFLLLRTMAEKGSGYILMEDMYRDIWGGGEGDDHNVVHTAVSRMNKKLESMGVKLKLVYKRGTGYRMEKI
ncbi:MAG: response regulator transcription factor [Lachnospiraceae bacterium]|nr:response regulator transcription factor [Lachnospiraceae bacterium]